MLVCKIYYSRGGENWWKIKRRKVNQLLSLIQESSYIVYLVTIFLRCVLFKL